MNRLRVRVFSAVLAVLAGFAPVRAQEGVPAFWFAGTRLIFAHAVALDGDVAVGVDDPGVQRFLGRLGATLSFAPQERYIIVTASDRRTIVFTLGSTQYSAGGVVARAAFAPYAEGAHAIVPLYALAHALYVEPLAAAGETVLQPQLGALDVRADGRRFVVTLRGATQLAFVTRTETPEHIELVFSGLASTLEGVHRVAGASTVTIVSGGPQKNPSTTVTFDAPRGSQHEFVVPGSPFEVGLAIGEADGSAPAAALNFPAPPVSNAPAAPVPDTAGLATVTAVTLAPAADGFAVRVSISGTPAYDWHRLADQRWYVDIRGVTLTDAGRDERPVNAAVESVRVRQIGTPDAPAVRIALTLRGERRVDVAPTADGLSIVASNAESIALVRSGSGRAGSDGAAFLAPASPAPITFSSPVPWKFGAPPAGSRIIVLDPGHGGSDIGTAHNGLTEKLLTFDIARRLRALLAAQGWNVRLTRDDDTDPVTSANLTAMAADGKPNPSDRAYLQTRCDVANAVNARLFISIHVNYSESPAVNGTTFYWYKPQDQLLATALEHSVIPTAGTTDMGPRHENFYVIRHTTMPAVLIETAFISNAHDAALLASPAFLQNMAQGIASGVKAYASVPVPDR